MSLQQNNVTKTLLIRIFNSVGTEFMIRKFKEPQVWTLPFIDITEQTTQEEHVLSIFNILKNEIESSVDFKIRAIIPIAKLYNNDNICNKTSKCTVSHLFEVYVYDVLYDGVVFAKPKNSQPYESYKWVNSIELNKLGPLNRATEMVRAKIMEKR